MTIELNKQNHSINHCLNCVGQHPDYFPDFSDFKKRTINPQKDVFTKVIQYKSKMHLYKNKSCQMCGRSYDGIGELDQTWKITAKRVHEELIHAGIFGVDDKKVELVVARCRKSVEFLFKNRFSLNPAHWEKFTFSGTLALIITHAQEARKGKLGTEDQFLGPVGDKK